MIRETLGGLVARLRGSNASLLSPSSRGLINSFVRKCWRKNVKHFPSAESFLSDCRSFDNSRAYASEIYISSEKEFSIELSMYVSRWSVLSSLFHCPLSSRRTSCWHPPAEICSKFRTRAKQLSTR